MASAICTDAWATESGNILFRGTTAPIPSRFRLCLSSSFTLTRNSSLVDFISSELLPINGYSRGSLNIPQGTYDQTDKRYELAASTSFSASGGSLQYQSVFLLANASSTASIGLSNTNLDPGTGIITIANHGLVNGDKLIFTDSGGSIPTGMTPGTIYTISNVTTNTFSLSGASFGLGAGAFRARYANGIVVAFFTESSPVLIPDGQGRSYTLDLAVMNTGYVNGV